MMKRIVALACFLLLASSVLAGPDVPKKGEAHTILFGMVEEADPPRLFDCSVTDTCYSYTGGSFSTRSIADTATQAGTTGQYAIDLVSGEMNHDYIVCKFTCSGGVDNMVTVRTTTVDVDDLATQASVDTIDGNVDAVLTDTNELQGDWTDGGRLDLILDDVLEDTTVIGAAVALDGGAATVGGMLTKMADDAGGGDYDAGTDSLATAGLLAASTNFVVFQNNTAIGVVLADTNELQQDWTNGGRLDLILDAVETDTQDIQSRLPAALVSGLMSSDVTAVSTDTTAANNLELQYDGITGLTGDIFPATQSQVGAIGAVPGAALPFAADTDNTGGAIKGATFDGVEISGTFASTEALDGVYHVIDDSGGSGNLDIVYGYSIGGNRTAVSVTFEGFLNNVVDELNIQAYDFIGTDWETRGILDGQGSSSDMIQTVALLGKHTGLSGSDIGKVYVRFQGTGLSNPSLNTDELLVSAVQLGQTVGYDGGEIWVNTLKDPVNENTENFVDGVADNPVSTWAAALTLSGQLGIVRFHIINGSSITLTGNSDHYTLHGDAWMLDLNGQSVVGSYFEGATVSGTATGTGVTQVFHDCLMGTVTHINGTHLSECGIGGTQTVGEAGDYFLDRCHSAIAGTGTWIFDFGAAIANTNLNVRNYSGGIQIENMGDTGTDTASIEGRGQIIEGTCTGGTVAVRGLFTTSGITNLTLSDDARFDSVSLVADNWDELLTGATHNIATSSGRRVRHLDELGVYPDHHVWVDTVNGAVGTTDYENGTIDNPVKSIANARTIAVSVGLTGFHILDGSSITLASTFDAYEFTGCGWSVALGGQSIEGTTFTGATVTGVGTATVTRPLFYDCLFGAATIPPAIIDNSGIGEGDGLFTGGSDGQYVFHECFSLVPGSDAPDFKFDGLGAATGINNRAWTGGASWTLDSNCTLSHEVLAGGGTTVTTGGADVEIRGITRSVTLTMSAAETVQFVGTTGPIELNGTTTATVNLYGISASVTDNTTAANVTDLTVNQPNINAECDTALSDIKLDHLVAVAESDDPADDSIIAKMAASDGDWSGFDEATDSLEAIRDLGDVSDGKIDTIDSNVDAILLDTGTTGVLLAPNSVTNAAIANGAIDKNKLAANTIGATAIASNAIGAQELATDAIGSDQLAASAATKIVNALMAHSLDGQTYENTVELIRAVLSGTTTSPGANQIEFKRGDGSVIATITYTGPGIRSTSVTP